MKKLKNKLHIYAFLIIVLPAFSQKSGQFPFSLFGFGEFEPLRFHHQQLTGGLSAAVIPDTLFPSLLNSAQPASLSDIRFATFEVGGKNRTNRLYSSNIKSDYYNYTSFDYAALGFPLGKKGGMNFGIAPFSTIGYSFQTVSFDPGIGNITYSYYGEGGISQAFLGMGFQPFKFDYIKYLRKNEQASGTYARLLKHLSNFRFGLNASWLFGQQIRQTTIRYPSSINNLHHFRESIIRPKGIHANIGLTWSLVQDSVGKKVLNNKNIYTFGIIYSPSIPIKLNEERYSFNFFSIPVNSNNNIKDSSEKIVKSNLTYRMPTQLTAGFNFKKGYAWNAGFEYTQIRFVDKVSVFSNIAQENFNIVSAGASWVPEKYAFGKGAYFKRVRYALGGSHSSGYVKLNGQKIQTLRLTSGISLPIGIRTGTGMLHLGMQYYTQNLHPDIFFKERGFCFIFGFTFNSTYLEDFWFRKFKYD